MGQRAAQRNLRRLFARSALAVTLLGGCTGEAPPPVAPQGPAGLAEAIAQSRAAGTARTATTMPPGVLPTTRITGVVDLAARRSETLIEIDRHDGAAVPYARIIRTGSETFLGRYLGRDEPSWQRSDVEPPGNFASPNFDGLLALGELERQMHGLRVDREAEGGYVIAGPPPVGGPTRRGLIVTAARVVDGRIADVEALMPSMAQAGAFRMAFSAYGEPVRIDIPAV